MKLTVVTATFNCINSGNREKLIRCIESTAKMKSSHEHLIYDGASTDGTVELLQSLAERIPGLKVVSEPDTGIYNALNKGVRDAKGEWLHILGADDYICSPETLDKLLDEAPQNVDALVTSVRKETENGESIWFDNINDLNSIFVSPCVCHQGELIKVCRARELGGFDEQYRIAADSDMFFKAHMLGCHFMYKFVSFAYFSYGGTANSNGIATAIEHRTSVANVLKLNGKARNTMIKRGILPLPLLLKLLFHKDFAIRKSALMQIKLRMASYLHIIKDDYYLIIK